MVAISTIISIGINVVASIAMSFIAKALRKKPKVDTDSLDFEQTVQRRLRNGQPLEVLVGRRITAGVGVFDDAWSTKNEKGVSVTVLSAKPCTQFHKLFVDGEPVTLSGNPTVGEVQVTSHFLGKNDARRVRVRLFLGQDNVGLGEYLASKFPGQFSAGDDGGEYCVLVTECHNTNDDFDEESGENFIPFQGYPEFKVELSGVKVCDPRNGGVYGDESTYAYSDNAALIDAQYDFGWYDGVGEGRTLIVGNGYPEGLMDMARISANADYCDTQNFSCAGVIRSGANDQEEIWKCFNADRVEHPASIYSVPEGNRTLSETIDLSLYPAAHISEYDEDGYSTEVYNEIQTVYAEPEEFYGEKDLPLFSDPGWIAADNHIPRQMSLPLLFVTDKAQAARLQKQEICISRTPATCTITDLPFGLIRVGVGDVITVTGSVVSAINDRQWIVKGKGQSPMGDVSLMLRAFAGADAFDFDEATEIPPIDINLPIPRPWPWWERLPYVNPGTVAGINTSVGNLNTDVNGIIAGTRPLTGILIENRGQLLPEVDGIGGNVTAILNGTAELANIQLTGRAQNLIAELDSFGVDIGSLDNSVGTLDSNVSGIIAGTTELTNVTLAGRGALTSELDGLETDLSSVTSDVTGIKDGTLPLTDVTLAGVGSLIDKTTAQDANITTATSSGSGLSVTVYPTFAYATTTNPNQSITTGTVSLTINNGSGSEAISYQKVSGDSVTINNPTSSSTSFTSVPTLLGKQAVYKAVVTDGGNVAEAQFSVTIDYFDPNNNV